MSTPTNRESVHRRLARLLDTTALAHTVPQLAPETLHQLVRHRGLDACGDVLAAATPAQLTALCDLDLWRAPRQGRDEQFDADRFGEWLEVLVDTGASVAARIAAALDTQVVSTGLSRYLRVFDPGTFEPTESSDDEALDRHAMMSSETPADALECEIGGYLVRARRPEAWDAMVTLLTTLDDEHHATFHALMRECRRLSDSRPEVDGLDALLMTPEQHLYDAAVAREQRRARRGYAAAADARAFLQLARQSRHAHDAAPSAPHAAGNPIARAYFRAADDEEDRTVSPPDGASPSGALDVSARENGDIARDAAALVELLAEAGVTPAPPRALPAAAEHGASCAPLPLLSRLMAFAGQQDEHACLERGRELAFLANTLLAGCSVQSRPLTPREAADAAASVCNLGLECWTADHRDAPHGPPLPDTFLVDHDLVAVFERGWSVLHQDVGLFAADRLIAILAALESADADTTRQLRALRRQLTTQREAGTPWLARDAADVLATFDAAAWMSVLGLLDECPIVHAALTAVLEGRTTPISPSAFQFIATRAQIGEITAFVEALPSLLSR